MDKNHEENLKKGRLLIKHLEEIQYSYFNGRPEWTTLQKNDLKLFLAYIYYGNPSSNAIEESNYEDHNNCEKIFKLYKDNIQTDILKNYKVIEENYIEPGHQGNIDVGITIIHSICKKKCDTCQNFPAKDIHKYVLVRLKLINNECIFIDFSNNRTYNSWDQYLNNNNLPEGFMFYPESGFYDPSKALYQNITPASKITEKICTIVENYAFIPSCIGCITLACGLVFPLATPIILSASTLFFGVSSFQVYRNFDKLVDMYKHANDLSGSKPWLLWMNLATAAIGAISAPLFAIAAITSEVNTTIQSTSKAFTIFQKSAFIAQCTLEVFRTTLEFIDNDFKITFKDVLKLRLDLFIVMGTLMPPSYVRNILNLLAKSCVWLPIYKTLEQIPYCLGQMVWNSVYFFKKHLTVFMEQVTMFLAEKLTVNNLFNSWKTIRHVFDGYQKQTAQLDVRDLLWHVVDDIAVDESVKHVLRGQRMVKLLESLSGKKLISRALVKYFVDLVLQEAMKLQAKRDDSVAELAKLGETRTWKVDEEFCKVYGLDRCAMDQYAKLAISEVEMNATAVMAEYEEYASRPENMFDDEMVFSESDRAAGWSTKGYTFLAPCSILDSEFCLQFSVKINPQPHHYLDHRVVQPEPGVSLIFGVSAYSINIVFFGIDLINGVPKMNVCFFEQNRDSDSSIAKHSGFKQLQAA